MKILIEPIKYHSNRQQNPTKVDFGVAFDIEETIERILNKARAYAWDEDHISFRLMEELPELFSDYQIHFDGWSKHVTWQSYKNKGRIENRFGDIALLLNIQFSTNEVLRGVALLEAKREYSSREFDALKLSQVERILSNAPHSQLLLYYRSPIDWHVKWPDDRTWRSSMWVSPLNTVVPLLRQLGSGDEGYIQRVCLPLSMFLTARAFWGLDLDYRNGLYEQIAKGGEQDELPAYLGVIDIYYDEQSPIKLELGSAWEPIETN